MKKFYYLTLAAALTLFAASCSKEIAPEQKTTEDESLVTFTAKLPSNLATRAFADGTTATSLQYYVYKDGVTNATVAQGTATFNASLDATVSLKLAKGFSYDILFWADNDAAPYTFDVATQSISVDYTNVNCNDENLDAFFRAEKDVFIDGPLSRNIKLYRPFAQLNIGTDDTPMPANTEVKVKVYNNLNLMTGGVTGESEITFASAAIPAGEAFPVTGYNYLAMNYLLVPEDKSLVDVTLTANSDSHFASVPVQRNYRTNIFGSLLTSDVNFTVTIVPAFEGEYDYDAASLSIGEVTYTTMAQALAAANDGDVIKLDRDIILEGSVGRTYLINKDITLDLNGNNITASIPDGTVGQSIFKVTGSANTLTIQGNGNFATKVGVNPNDQLSAVVDNQGGNVVIKGGDFSMSSPSKAWGTEAQLSSTNLLPCFVDNNTTLGESNLTINGGTFEFTRMMMRNFCNNSTASANITINGGAFTGGAIWMQDSQDNDTVQGQITVNGGTFDGTRILNELHNEDVEINNGVVVTVVNRNGDYIHSGVRKYVDGENTYYEIVNKEGLAYASTNLFPDGGEYYIKSMNMAGVAYTPAEVGVNKSISIEPYSAYSATVISNLSVTSGIYASLIGRFSGQNLLVKGITIEGANLTGTNNTDGEYSAGGIVGWCEGHAASSSLLIEDCVIRNSTFGPTKYVGGVVGYQAGESVTIKNCTVTYCTLKSDYLQGTIYKGHCGGLVGYLYDGQLPNGTITHNTFTTHFSSGYERGGLVVGSFQAGTITSSAMTISSNTGLSANCGVVNSGTWN